MEIVLARQKSRNLRRERFLLVCVTIFLLTITAPYVSYFAGALSADTSRSTAVPDSLDTTAPIPLTLMLHDSPAGARVNGTVLMGLQYNPETNMYALGFMEDFLRVTDSPVYTSVIGLGYIEVRVHFEMLGGPLNGSEDHVYRAGEFPHGQPPQWRAYSAERMDTPEFSSEDLSHLVYASCTVEFVNLSIYYADGTESPCGPEVIGLRVDYVRSGTGWDVFYTLSSSSEDGVEVRESVMYIFHDSSSSISPLFIGIVATDIGVVGAMVGRRFIRKRRSMQEGPQIVLCW